MTRKANLPPGYLTFRRTERLTGGARFEEAATILLHWEVQRRAGIRLTSSSNVIIADVVVDLRLGLGRLSVLAPCGLN
jgi:uncharacterized protein (UPF0548 family)